MKSNWILFVVAGVVGILLIVMIPTQQRRSVNETGVPPGWIFTLPLGDSKTGRTTFMELRCHMCHNISLPDDNFPESKPGVGRNLRVIFADLPNEYVAQCLLNVHTVVPDPCYDVQAEQTAGESARHYLTVKELADLVAFLKQNPEGNVED